MKNEQQKRAIQAFREGASEIESLQRQVAQLAQYRDHTERLLALFEGGPPQSGSSPEGENVAWKLRRMAETWERQADRVDDSEDSHEPG